VIVYLDASALVKRYVAEAGSEQVRALVRRVVPYPAWVRRGASRSRPGLAGTAGPVGDSCYLRPAAVGGRPPLWPGHVPGGKAMSTVFERHREVLEERGIAQG
jgi:hypothetical protein